MKKILFFIFFIFFNFSLAQTDSTLLKIFINDKEKTLKEYELIIKQINELEKIKLKLEGILIYLDEKIKQISK